jgi:ribosomal protein L37AE/L43A
MEIMAEFKFKCPYCKQPLAASEELFGQQINCPSCNGAIAVPNPEPRKIVTPQQEHSQTKTCPFCGEEILLSAIKCKHCGEFLDGRKRNVPPQSIQTKQAPGIPTCQQCGGVMKKTVISSGNCTGIVVALIVFCGGIVIAVAIPVIGWVIGPIICIGALFMGGKRSKVWKCTKCGSVVNRA